MSTVEEIEAAITRLDPSEYEEFRKWLVEYDNRLWDKEMEEDARTGKLNPLISAGLDDLKNNRCTAL